MGDYKSHNRDFRYIIRNDVKDIKVLIKRASEGLNLPYRSISFDILGALTPLKTANKDPTDNDNEELAQPDDEAEFLSPGRTHRRKNYIPKEQIFSNITAILNGFEATFSRQQKQ